MKSMIGGAAVAALVTLPAMGADSWVNPGPKDFDARSVEVDQLVGNLSIAVRDGGPITFQASGFKPRVDALSAQMEDGRLVVRGEAGSGVWDWHHWFDFSNVQERRSDLTVKLTVPRGTSVKVDDLIGNADIGDTMGSLHFGAVSTTSHIGRVADAHIEVAGEGRVTIADINGDLHADSAGAGMIKTGNVHSVHADLAGAGGLQVGAINGSLHLDIAGAGDFSAASVNGAVSTDILGSGSVNIGNGQANPLHVSIAGSGNFIFGGVAVDPHIETWGSGHVQLKAYRGNLHNEGMGDIQVGGTHIEVHDHHHSHDDDDDD